MTTKKYNITKILREIDEKYGGKSRLKSLICEANVLYNIDTDSFVVSYRGKGETESHQRSLISFTNFFVFSNVPSLTPTIKYIIRQKEQKNTLTELVIWPSTKVKYAYLCTNYFSSAGQLGKSCMRGRDYQKALNFYVKNNVKIVVLKDNNNKIHARALLWEDIKSTRLKDSFTYLDRVYANSENHILSFIKLANSNNWKYYKGTSADEGATSYYKDNVNIKNICHMPWMDTFRYLYYKDGVITGGKTPKTVKNSLNYIELRRTSSGGYFPEIDENRITEVLTGNYISKKDAIYVKKYSGHVLKENIVDINGDYYSRFDNCLTKTKLDGYILKEDAIEESLTMETISKSEAIYAPEYKGYVHESNVVKINNKIYHKKDENIVYSEKWYHISQCFVNYIVNEEERESLLRHAHPNTIDFTEEYIKYVTFDRDFDSGIIPKEHAIIVYNIKKNPVNEQLEYFERYCLKGQYPIIKVNTGEYVIDNSENRKHLKKFNNKYYIKERFEPPNKNQLMLF